MDCFLYDLRTCSASFWQRLSVLCEQSIVHQESPFGRYILFCERVSAALSTKLRCAYFLSKEAISKSAVFYSHSIVIMALSCIISEIKQDTGRKIAIFSYPLHSTPPLGESLSSIAIRVTTFQIMWNSPTIHWWLAALFPMLSVTHIMLDMLVLLNTGIDANMQLTINSLSNFFPDTFLTFSKIPDISLTAVKIPNISRFSRQVVTLCHTIWYGKTRMVWLPEGEKSMMMCLAVSTE